MRKCRAMYGGLVFDDASIRLGKTAYYLHSQQRVHCYILDQKQTSNSRKPELVLPYLSSLNFSGQLQSHLEVPNFLKPSSALVDDP